MRYLAGDLLRAPIRTIAHGCNARGKMGKGIAKKIKDAYPGAYEVYKRKFEEGGLKLGDVIPWKSERRNILNCVIQDSYGPPPTRYVSYDAVRSCMRVIEKAASAHISRKSGIFHEEPSLGIPRMGAGLAGGEWGEIARIIEEEVKSVEVIVFDFSPVQILRAPVERDEEDRLWGPIDGLR